MLRFSIFPEALAVADDVALLVGLVVLVLMVVRAMRAGRPARPASAPPEQEEEVTLRRLCDQLERMERRLDNLETILNDKRERKEP